MKYKASADLIWWLKSYCEKNWKYCDLLFPVNNFSTAKYSDVLPNFYVKYISIRLAGKNGTGASLLALHKMFYQLINEIAIKEFPFRMVSV